MRASKKDFPAPGSAGQGNVCPVSTGKGERRVAPGCTRRATALASVVKHGRLSFSVLRYLGFIILAAPGLYG